jgi:hypothetical protein
MQQNFSLDRLPGELISHIFNYVADSHYPTLQSLALTNRRCHSFAIQPLFNSFTLEVTSQSQLESFSKNISTNVLQNICFLTVDGSLPGEPTHEKHARLVGVEIVPKRAQGLFYNTKYHQNWKALQSKGHSDHGTWRLRDREWEPLGTVISNIKLLKSFIWNCPLQLPSCLLTNIEKNHPRCHLIINTFHLRSLFTDQPIVIDPQDLALATSPCLHSVAHGTIPFDGGAYDYNKDAILDLCTGLNPSLKVVHLFPMQMFAALFTWEDKQQWKGLSLPSQEGLGSLDHLALHGRETEVMKTWNDRIDLSLLKILELTGSTSITDLEYLTTNCRFLSLHTLILSCPLRQYSSSKDGRTDCNIAVENFITSIPFLKALQLGGKSTIDSILQHHGSTITDLSFTCNSCSEIIFDENKIIDIRNNCPQLTNLRLKVRRSQGDLVEQSIYKTIGSIRKLSSLNLYLDASNPTLNSSEDHELLVNGIQREFVRLSFIDAALDENLAEEIFHSISCGKPKGEPPLQSLQVRVTGAMRSQRPNSGGFGVLASRMKRAYLVEPHPRDDCRGKVVVTYMRQRRYKDTFPLYTREAKAEFLKLWPYQGEEGCEAPKQKVNESIDNATWDHESEYWDEPWMDNWHSFPLQKC